MYRISTFFALAFALTLAACDTGGEFVDQELITEVTLTITPEGGGSPLTITASDPDGDLVIDSFSPARLTVPAGTHAVTIRLTDTINDEDITAEIRELAEEHLFRYTLSPASAGSVTITDSESDYTEEDGNDGDFNVGLAFDLTVNASATGNGTLNATLFHFDEDPKPSSTATSDEIDVDIDFPISFGSVVTAR